MTERNKVMHVIFRSKIFKKLGKFPEPKKITCMGLYVTSNFTTLWLLNLFNSSPTKRLILNSLFRTFGPNSYTI